jgi:hypothetical protein
MSKFERTRCLWIITLKKLKKNGKNIGEKSHNLYNKVEEEFFCKTKEMAERKIQKKNKNKEEIK